MINSLKKHGVVIVKNAFKKSMIKDILKEWKSTFKIQLKQNEIEGSFKDSIAELFNKNNSAFKYSGKLCYGLNSLFRLGCSKEMKKLIKQGGVKQPVHNTRPLILVNSNRTALHEDYARYPAHQDWKSSQGSLNSLVVWCPLINLTKKHGLLEFVKGSHKWGLLETKDQFQTVPEIKEDFDQSLWSNSGAMDVGDAIVFSTLLVHRSGQIKGDNFRWSASFRFNDLQEKTYIKRGFVEPYSYQPPTSLVTSDFPTKSQIEECFNELS